MGLLLPRRVMNSGVANFITPTYRTSYTNSTTYTSTHTYTLGASIAIGNAPTGGDRRFVIIAANCQRSTASVSISDGGVNGASIPSGQRVMTSNTNGNESSVYMGWVEVASGTTCSATITVNASIGIGSTVYSVVTGAAGLGVDMNTEVDDTSPQRVYSNCKINDLLVGVTGGPNSAAMTWTVDAASVGTRRVSFDLASSDWCSLWDHTLSADDASVTVANSANNTNDAHITAFGRFYAA